MLFINSIPRLRLDQPTSKIEMARSESQLQSLGICHRLFCFIMKTFAAQALKPVTLGRPETCSLLQQPICTNLPGVQSPPSQPAGENITELSAAAASVQSSASIVTASTACMSNAAGDGDVMSPFQALKENDSTADQEKELGDMVSTRNVDGKTIALKKMVAFKKQ
ncbi:hypothetical protein Ancab_000786 [Ancistrocladus abbreviatus]